MPRAGAMIARPNSSQSSLLLQHRNNRRGGSFTTSARPPLGGCIRRATSRIAVGFFHLPVSQCLACPTVRGAASSATTIEIIHFPVRPPGGLRVLKKNEIARFGEYRTARLVLAA